MPLDFLHFDPRVRSLPLALGKTLSENENRQDFGSNSNSGIHDVVDAKRVIRQVFVLIGKFMAVFFMSIFVECLRAMG
jgi:hypothetical protein